MIGGEDYRIYVESAALEDAASNLGQALDRNLTSVNETDRNLEPPNVVDGLFAIARGLRDVADAVRELAGP